MDVNEIERALGNDRRIEPSTDLSARVMVAVRQQARERDGLPFPWRLLVGGLAACTAVVAAGIAVGPIPSAPPGLIAILDDPAVVRALAWIPTSLVGTWALAWASLRWCRQQ